MRQRLLAALSLVALVTMATSTPLFVAGQAPPGVEQRLAEGDGSVELPRQKTRRARRRTRVWGSEAPTEPSGPLVVPATVLLRDARGHPVAGVPAVSWGGLETSDRHGRIVVPVPWTARPSVSLTFRNVSAGPIQLEPGTTEIELSQVIPLEVHLVDAERGTPIEGSVEVAFGAGGFVHMMRVGSFHELDPAPLEPARDARLRFRMTLPAGYPERTSSATRTAFVSRYAKRVRVTLPVRPEARVLLRVVDQKGDPVAGASVPHVTLAGRRQEPVADVTNARGETRLRGLSLFRGYVLRVQVAAPEGRMAVGSAYLADVATEAIVDVVVRPEPEYLGSYRGPVGEVPGCPGVSNAKRAGGALTLWLVRRGGAPAAHARTRVNHDGGRWDTERADEYGRLRYTDLPAGRFTVELVEAGLVYTRWTFELDAGEAVEEVVREDAGHTLLVIAHNERGTPLPYVRLHVSPRRSRDFTWLDDDDVQRLDVHTDAWGRARIPTLPEPSAFVKAEYAALQTGDYAPVTEPLLLTFRDPLDD